VTELREAEKEVVEKLRDFIASDRQDWVLRREDLQSAGTDMYRYSEDGVKRVLHEIESVISQATGYEIGVVLDKNGRFVMAKRGEAGSVSVPVEDSFNCIFTHNHPNGYLAFSVGDVAVFSFYQLDEVRAVTCHDKFVSLKITDIELRKDLMRGMRGAGLDHPGMAVPETWLQGVDAYGVRRADKYGYVFKGGDV